jgi:hypothetical protein
MVTLSFNPFWVEFTIKGVYDTTLKMELLATMLQFSLSDSLWEAPGSLCTNLM